MGEPFTAKDFRAWSGTVLALHALTKEPVGTSKAARKREIKRALQAVSDELGSTVAVCRKSYVHPSLLAQYSAGELASALQLARRKAKRRRLRGLRSVEIVVLGWLEGLARVAVF